MQLSWSHAVLYVSDEPKMLDFYTKVLGFEVTDRGPLGSTKSILEPLAAKKISYIEEDAEPEGYGPGKLNGVAAGVLGRASEGGSVERRINVTRGPGNQGMRTVVLHVPKDIK